MPGKEKRAKKPAPSRRHRMWPIKMYRTPDGQLHDVCHVCNGSGKQYREVGFSDSGGLSELYETGAPCRACNGTGLDRAKVNIIDHDGKTPPR